MNAMKIFGIGLSRTGTTSMSLAMLDLGFKTCHACFKDETYDRADAFFDTPIWADYPLLDKRYPGSKFILTWRSPDKWYHSFSKNLGDYLSLLRNSPRTNLSPIDRRTYQQIYGQEGSSKEHLLACYHAHRQAAETYFAERPGDFLILELDQLQDVWDTLCPFLGVPKPPAPFPHTNVSGRVNDWEKVYHPHKIIDELTMDHSWLKWTRENLERGCDPAEILQILLNQKFPIALIRQAMKKQFPHDHPSLQNKA